ncbi:RNA methyltransferase [Candidatus Gracilibacteria bacterium]|nr:RNA methyltransferase [Candidatus Gracilibacteria bacterium]NUJ98914.1 RNA methyltransferase [Candidatus Gracilibacteria bacterium]
MKEKIILLDSLRSLQNVGAIFRNADGAGFTKLILCGHTPTPPRSDIAKTALGAEKTIDWEYFKDGEKIIQKLKNDGYKIFALETGENAKDFREYQNKNFEKVCVVVGNEVKGVDEKILGICDEIIMIPMMGKKSSLNVSVAAGIIMYTFL